MITVFQILIKCQREHNLQPLTHNQKSNLGRVISEHWNSVPDRAKPLLIKSVEDTGVFNVFAYPDDFAEKIQDIILSFYKVTKKRKRMPIRKKIAYSAKPSSNNTERT